MTTTTLRPNGTISGTPTGAASAHAALSDDSDSSYVAGSPECIVDLGSVTLSGGVTKTIKLRARASRPSGALPLEAAVITPSKSVVGGLISMATTITITDYDSGPTAVTLTQAQVDELRILAAWSVNSDGSHSTSLANNCYELYVDLVWVAVPVVSVTVVAPDPYTASNLVPISWTNTLDSDGGTQTRRRVKVFSAAQYGIGGFNPETSPFTWDSSEVITGSLSATTAALPTASTYRAYVKVAQTVNGVAHWSAWAYDQFEVDVDTSDIQTVTAHGSNGLASITVTVERVAASEAWAYIEVQRSVNNGATWSPVRGATYVDATGNANTFTVTDYETGNDEAALYRARATRIVSGLPIAGAWVASTVSASWSSTSAWLKSPSNPARNLPIDVDTPFVGESFNVRSGVFPVLGSAAPVVISDVMSTATSQLQILVDSEADQNELRVLLRDVILLYHPTECEGTTTGRYLSVTSAAMQPQVRRNHVYRVWTVNYVEIDPPADPAASAP